jgi:hypothetical protein
MLKHSETASRVNPTPMTLGDYVDCVLFDVTQLDAAADNLINGALAEVFDANSEDLRNAAQRLELAVEWLRDRIKMRFDALYNAFRAMEERA